MAETMMAQERHKLRKVFRRWDMIFFSVAALVGLDSVAPMASGALGEGLVWTFIFVIIWLIPYGLLTAELGTAFPAEGGIYAWVRIAYGKLPGEITAIFYWFSTAIWIGGTLAAATIKAIDVFITPNKPLGLWPSVIIGLAFVWVNVWLSVIAFKHGKWAGNIGAWVKALAVVLFVITVARLPHQEGRAPRSGLRVHLQALADRLPRRRPRRRLPLRGLRAAVVGQ